MSMLFYIGKALNAFSDWMPEIPSLAPYRLRVAGPSTSTPPGRSMAGRRIKQLSQVNSCFSQLRMNPGDFRGNIPRLADEMGQGLRDRSDRCLRWPFNSGLRNSEKTAALNESR